MTFDKLKEIIINQLDVDAAKLVPTADIIKDIGADSLDIVEILISVEEAFGITVEDDDVSGFKTLQDVVDYIDARK